jgi:hypothetical protein
MSSSEKNMTGVCGDICGAATSHPGHSGFPQNSYLQGFRPWPFHDTVGIFKNLLPRTN